MLIRSCWLEAKWMFSGRQPPPPRRKSEWTRRQGRTARRMMGGENAATNEMREALKRSRLPRWAEAVGCAEPDDAQLGQAATQRYDRKRTLSGNGNGGATALQCPIN
jgi:hypothetical protein